MEKNGKERQRTAENAEAVCKKNEEWPIVIVMMILISRSTLQRACNVRAYCHHSLLCPHHHHHVPKLHLRAAHPVAIGSGQWRLLTTSVRCFLQQISSSLSQRRRRVSERH